MKPFIILLSDTTVSNVKYESTKMTHFQRFTELTREIVLEFMTNNFQILFDSRFYTENEARKFVAGRQKTMQLQYSVL